MCVECGCRARELLLKSASVDQIQRCTGCGRRVDRYFELNSTIKLIDLLLLKRRVFRHYLFNCGKSPVLRMVLVLAAMLAAKPVFRHQTVLHAVYEGRMPADLLPFCRSMGRSIAETLLWTGLLCIAFRRAGAVRMAAALVLSSFYHVFVFVMMVWKYQDEEYLLVTDFLCAACNAIVVSEICGMRNETAACAVCASKLLANLVCRVLF